MEIQKGKKEIQTINVKLDNNDRLVLDDGKALTYQIDDNLFINVTAKRTYNKPE